MKKCVCKICNFYVHVLHSSDAQLYVTETFVLTQHLDSMSWIYRKM